MKIYTGKRGPDGGEAFVDGRPLPLRLDLANHSPTGVEWGYYGSGPAQLALALLSDALGNDHDARGWYQIYKDNVVAGLEHDTWTLTEDEVKAKVDEFRRTHVLVAAHIEGERASFNFSNHIKACLQCHRAELGEAPEMCATGQELFETWEKGGVKA